MRSAKNDMDGLSIHYYVMPGKTWDDRGSAVHFDENEWFVTLKKALAMDQHITSSLKVMDTYDPEHSVGLIVDEWGSFYACERGNCEERFWGFDGEYMAFQQNTLRDAMVAACTLHIFNAHCERVPMANLSMTVNQLHSLILTEDEKFLLTPTYHVFDLYKGHQNALLLPHELECGDYTSKGERIPKISFSASKSAEGYSTLSVCNVDPREKAELTCTLKGMKVEHVTAQTITSEKMNDHNTFENPETVRPKPFNNLSWEGENLKMELAPKSITVLQVS
jgi:alpha-N-arabinofuranosidase